MKRRTFVTALAATGLAGCGGSLVRPERGPIAAVFADSADDDGIAGAGLRGLQRVGAEFGITVSHQDRIAPDGDAALGALRAAARSNASMVIVVGESLATATQRAAWEFPAQRFSTLGSDATTLRPNIARYHLAQEQSAWLAGALAGLTSKTKVVGHLADRRDMRHLHARAAFAAGLAAVSSDVQLLTTITPAVANPAEAERYSLAMTQRGADILYASLDRGRAGAVTATRGRHIALIGDGIDWVEREPATYFAAAVADADRLMLAIARDLVDSVWRGDLVRRFGVRQNTLVRLSLTDRVPAATRERLADLRQELLGARIDIPTSYSGPEFAAS